MQGVIDTVAGAWEKSNWQILAVSAAVAASGLFLAHMTRRRRVSGRYAKILIIGGTRGLGMQLQRQFVKLGDKVVVVSRSPPSSSTLPGITHSISADVSRAESVSSMMQEAFDKLGGCDAVICNAAITQKKKGLLAGSTAEELQEASQVVQTNLAGSMMCAAAAIGEIKQRGGYGHIFLMEGAGSNARATPNSAAYGASKAGLNQLAATLYKEVSHGRHGVGVHLLYPGMMITDLLMRSCSSPTTARVFNVLAEPPATVAEWMVPYIRSIALQSTGKKAIPWPQDKARSAEREEKDDASAGPSKDAESGESAPDMVSSGEAVRFLQPLGVIWRFMGWFGAKDRLIDEARAPILVQEGRDWREAVTDPQLYKDCQER